MKEKNLVTLPSKVITYLEYMKRNNHTLLGALQIIGVTAEMEKYMEDYLNISSNQEKFALAWINGYKVEENFYKVRLIGFRETSSYIKKDLVSDNWYFGDFKNYETSKVIHTHDELEKAGFGWVFSSEGVEIIEVDND